MTTTDCREDSNTPTRTTKKLSKSVFICGAAVLSCVPMALSYLFDNPDGVANSLSIGLLLGLTGGIWGFVDLIRARRGRYVRGGGIAVLGGGVVTALCAAALIFISLIVGVTPSLFKGIMDIFSDAPF